MVDDPPAAPAPPVCPDCGAQVAPALLACPACHRLVHADALKRLAADAEQAKQTGDTSAELAAWRQALELLPPDTAQHQTVTARVAELSRAVDRQPAGAKHGSRLCKGAAGGLGALGLLLAKFKFALVFVITKAKLLVLGLTKASTLLSMLLSMGVYWTHWGWKFAAGFVVSIYIHEMGHVAKLHAYGIKADAPMFIPGLGAFVRMRQYPATPVEDARVGLAGPLWGLGAAIASFLVFFLTKEPLWAGIGRIGAVVNLFNLIPIWQLDGGRGFRSLTRNQRILATAVVGAALLFSGEGMATLALAL